jgi:uncharacterized protein involved in exopolysaccharide biosynthesis
MNIDDRLRAASQALKESSVAQVDAASRLREIVRRTGQPVAHGHTVVLLEEPQESPRSLAPSLPPSGKVSAAAAGSSAVATPHQHWTDGETMSTFHSQPPSGNAVGRLLRSIWRYKSLIAAAVLLGALLGSGWAARQPTLYEGVTRVLMTAGRTSLPGDVLPQPPGDSGRYRDNQAQMMRSAPVLQRAAQLSGNRISVETLRQRLEVEVAAEADVLTIRVVDSSPKGAAELANAVGAAYERFAAEQSRAALEQLRSARSRLETRLADIQARLAESPNDGRLGRQRDAVAEELLDIQRLLDAERLPGSNRVLMRERAAVPERPITPGPGRAMVIGMLLGLLASVVLVWWRTRGQRPMSRSSAPEQGPERPRA